MIQPNWKQFLISFAVLVASHSLVSIIAWHCFTKEFKGTTVNSPFVETTTPEQKARGEASFQGLSAKVVKRFTPTPVVYYIFFGYLGLASALVVAIYHKLFD